MEFNKIVNEFNVFILDKIKEGKIKYKDKNEIMFFLVFYFIDNKDYNGFINDCEKSNAFFNLMKDINKLARINDSKLTDEEIKNNHFLSTELSLMLIEFYIIFFNKNMGYKIDNDNFNFYYNFIKSMLELLYVKDERFKDEDVLVFNFDYLEDKHIIRFFLEDFFIKNSIVKENYYNTKNLSMGNKNLFIDELLVGYLKVRFCLDKSKHEGLFFNNDDGSCKLYQLLCNNKFLNNENLLNLLIKNSNYLSSESYLSVPENNLKVVDKINVENIYNENIYEFIKNDIKTSENSRVSYLINGFKTVHHPKNNNENKPITPSNHDYDFRIKNKLSFKDLYDSINGDVNLLKKIEYSYNYQILDYEYYVDDEKPTIDNINVNLPLYHFKIVDDCYNTIMVNSFHIDNEEYNNYFINNLINEDFKTKFIFLKIFNIFSFDIYETQKISSPFIIKLFSDYLFLLIYEKIDDKEMKNNILNEIKNSDVSEEINFIQFVKDVKLDKSIIDVHNKNNYQHNIIYRVLNDTLPLSLSNKNHYVSKIIYDVFKNSNIIISTEVNNIKIFGDLTILNNDYCFFNEYLKTNKLNKMDDEGIMCELSDLYFKTMTPVLIYVENHTEKNPNVYYSKNEISNIFLINLIKVYLYRKDIENYKKHFKQFFVDINNCLDISFLDTFDYINLKLNELELMKNNKENNKLTLDVSIVSLTEIKESLYEIYNIEPNSKNINNKKIKV